MAFPGVRDGKGASPEPCSGSTAHIPQFREEVNVELNLRSWIEILDTAVLRHHSLALHPRVSNPSVTNPPKEDTWHHTRKCLSCAGGRQLDPHSFAQILVNDKDKPQLPKQNVFDTQVYQPKK